ncbi:putative F-box/LRR-repeat protein [Tanacetum coccineum]
MDRTSGDTFSTINKKDSKKRAEEDDYEIDRLTYLPDPILFLILSFLPFKQWILMRQVSKTFKNLWTHAPVLDFQAPKSRFAGHMTCHCCGAFHGHDLPRECYFYYIERFCRFVSRTLLEHSGDTIKVFHLALNYYDHPWDEFMLKRWVDFMFTKDIENLDLNFDESNSFMYYEGTSLRVTQMYTKYLYYLPHQDFISKMLSAMSLQYCQLNASYFGTFESLKYLCLRNVALLDNKITDFLSKFPMLLSLVLEKCVFWKDFFVLSRWRSGSEYLPQFHNPELLAEVYDFQENSFWETHDSAITCVQYSLNTVTIYGFSGRVVEVEFLKLLLRKGQALEKIYIQEFEGEEEDSMWVSNVAHIYNSRIANAVHFASTRVQVIIK